EVTHHERLQPGRPPGAGATAEGRVTMAARRVPREEREDGRDAIVVGAGLAGLVAACEIADGGRSVLLLEREGQQDLGAQAWWSFGGLFLIDSPEQRRLGVRDSLDLARQDWLGSAGFERPEDHWPRRWAEAYLQFAAGEKR